MNTTFAHRLFQELRTTLFEQGFIGDDVDAELLAGLFCVISCQQSNILIRMDLSQQIDLIITQVKPLTPNMLFLKIFVQNFFCFVSTI